MKKNGAKLNEKILKSQKAQLPEKRKLITYANRNQSDPIASNVKKYCQIVAM